MKLCTDCRHFSMPDVPGMAIAKYGKCNSPSNVRGKHPVDGSNIPVFIHCEELRASRTYGFGGQVLAVCGPEGIWYEDQL